MKKMFSFKKRFKLVRDSTKRDKELFEFYNFFKNKRIKNHKFNIFHDKLNNPKIICSINMGRVGSQFFFENLNKRLNLICAPNLFNSRNKKKYSKHKDFEDFFFYSLKKINYNNVIFFEISPKRFLKLIKYLEIKTLKKFDFHFIFRKNIIKQSLSYFNALNTNVWNNYNTKRKRKNLLRVVNYDEIKLKLKEILKNIISFERKTLIFLNKHKYNYSKQIYEKIINNSIYEENKFIKFYDLKNKLLIKPIKKNNYIKKNAYEKNYYKISKEFKNDVLKNSILKNRIIN
jgi:hypothetical protein